jgi:hypothetical protein
MWDVVNSCIRRLKVARAAVRPHPVVERTLKVSPGIRRSRVTRALDQRPPS